MKKDALKDIKKISITVAMEAVENLINNSVDKKKLDILYSKSLEKAKRRVEREKKAKIREEKKAQSASV